MRSAKYQSRRSFLKQSVLGATTLLNVDFTSAAAIGTKPNSGAVQGAPTAKKPWYSRSFRWGQTNIVENDPPSYDVGWWREYWKRTRVQGVIINAGGIVAYYPSRYPLQHRAAMLGDRDLYGELARAAHQDGLTVLARMDSNRAHEDLFRAHPDWIPGILREIIERTQPEGFTDNSWSGLGRSSICYCENCARKFRERAGKAI